MWAGRATPALLNRLLEVSRSTHAGLAGVNFDNGADDDAHSFLAAHLPAITLHSITEQTWGILHSPRDREEAVRMSDYYASYRLAGTYLAYLDAVLE